MSWKNATVAFICLEGVEGKTKELHCGFVVLDEAFARLPREELGYCARKSGVAEKLQ